MGRDHALRKKQLSLYLPNIGRSPVGRIQKAEGQPTNNSRPRGRKQGVHLVLPKREYLSSNTLLTSMTNAFP